MPRKPVIKKKRYAKRRPYNKRRKFKSNRENMVNKMPKSAHTVVAPHYYTSVEASFYGVVGATGGTSAGQFIIDSNSISSPFHPNAGNAFTDMTGATLSPGTNTLNVLAPAGVTRLGALYNSYRVYKYLISVTATPAAAQDAIGLTIVPFNPGAGPTVIGLSQQELMSLPYSKAIMCSFANDVSKNRVVSSLMPRTILGLTKLQYKDESDTSGFTDQAGTITATTPGSATSCIVMYNTLDDADLTAKVFFEVKLRLWLEFFEPIQDLGVI